MANSEIKVGIPRSAFFSCIGVLIMAVGTLVNNGYQSKFNSIDEDIKLLTVEAKADRLIMNKTLGVMETYVNLYNSKEK